MFFLHFLDLSQILFKLRPQLIQSPFLVFLALKPIKVLQFRRSLLLVAAIIIAPTRCRLASTMRGGSGGNAFFQEIVNSYSSNTATIVIHHVSILDLAFGLF